MKTSSIGHIPVAKLTFPLAGRDHIQGLIDAPSSLLEYGDYECPYCGESYFLIKKLQERLGDNLCFAFRNFPLATAHPHAESAAEAAEAADEQGSFWEMHDILYEHQDSLEIKNITQYANVLGLDAKRLVAEVVSGAHAARIREDFKSGVRSGVNGTPTLFINGARYDGSRDLESLLTALSQEAGVLR